MRKILISGIALAIALMPLPGAAAAEVDARALESIVAGIESLVGGLEGVDLSELEVRSHRSGLRSVAIPLPEATRDRLLAQSASAKDFKPLAVGLQLTQPGNFSTLITAVSALTDRDYHFWFAVMNLRATDQSKKTIFQRKGPGQKFKVTETLDYDGGALILFFLEANSGNVGASTIQVKITGGGKAKTGYFAQ